MFGCRFDKCIVFQLGVLWNREMRVHFSDNSYRLSLVIVGYESNQHPNTFVVIYYLPGLCREPKLNLCGVQHNYSCTLVTCMVLRRGNTFRPLLSIAWCSRYQRLSISTFLQLWSWCLCICCCSSQESNGSECEDMYYKLLCLVWFQNADIRLVRSLIIWGEKTTSSGAAVRVISLFWTPTWGESSTIWWVTTKSSAIT